MKNAIAIAKKELNIYFATPIAYVMFTLFVVIGSYFFLRLLNAYEQASLMYMRFNAGEMANRLNFQDAIFRNLFGNLGVILIFIVPFLTMRVVAALITFVVLLMTWIIGWTASEAEGWVRDTVTYLASVTHLDSFSKGTLELKDMVYFLSIIVLGLFATNRAVEAHRWS